jgi:hypothetical protein
VPTVAVRYKELKKEGKGGGFADGGWRHRNKWLLDARCVCADVRKRWMEMGQGSPDLWFPGSENLALMRQLTSV